MPCLAGSTWNRWVEQADDSAPSPDAAAANVISDNGACPHPQSSATAA
jgi:hypothetical protein